MSPTADPALAWVLCAAALYWLGRQRSAPDERAHGQLRRLAFFVAGLVTIVIALNSPIDHLADELLWVHMVQHVLLLLVAPPLLALAHPWAQMWRGLPLGLRRPTARWAMKSPRAAPLRSAAAILKGPVASWLLFNFTLVFWHLPFAYDVALGSPLLHVLEHASFFATALLFWTRVIDSSPWRSPLSDLGRAVYLGLALLASWVLAIVLALAGTPLYAHYAAEATRPGGISALTDQQLAAGVMWVPGSIPFTIAILLMLNHWLDRKPPRPTAPAPGLAAPEG